MNPKYKRDFIKAGEIAREVRAYGKSLVVPGASYNGVIENILKKIASFGAIPAFPPQIALNDVAAHYLPAVGEDIVFLDQVVKLDIGVCCNGAIGDCAVTVDLSGKHQVLVDAAEAALKAAQDKIEVGLPIEEIGRTIETTIASFGLRAVKNLSGHGLALYQVHTAPSIPNYYYPHSAKIRAGMTFAIEPFATNGKGLIYEKGEATLFSLTKVPSENSPVIYRMKSFSGLPFSIHDLISPQITLDDAKKTIQKLLKKGELAAYPPLVEQQGGMVAQAENSVLVDEKGNVHITTAQ